MNIEIAEHARMSESGSSLLRLIQNNDLPVLDLLVREVVQNSLDAASPDGDCVEMDFISGTFSPVNLNHHFDEIGKRLNRRFAQAKCEFLSIRDSNTVGLTGPLHFDDAKDGEFGNLLKLVYEISMPQQNEGAGGSWGLGKTVYFRVGIGLVLYYSRIKTQFGYESRMAATLVEDQTQPDAMLPAAPGTKLKRGIAWWGKKSGKNKTLPLRDDREISQILSVFGIKEYTGNETGTTVIIPYIDSSKLLSIPVDEARAVWWYSDISEYIKVALQRWYAPRLMNTEYKNGKWLRAKVNGKGIAKSEFLPLFLILQKLYNRNTETGFNFKDIQVRNVLQNSSVSGYVAFTKLSRQQLKMLPPSNMPNPYIQAQLHDVDKDSNPPVICFTRKPGMIVNYEITGKWVDGIPRTREDEYIVGIFVANSENRLKNDWQGITLEEYVRKSEKADHTTWCDWNNPGEISSQLISRIQRGIRKALSDEYSQPVVIDGIKKNIGLGRMLAEMLLPPENFGLKASFPRQGGGGGGGGGGNPSGTNPRLSLTEPTVFSSGVQTIAFELFCGRKDMHAEVVLKLSAENGDISVGDWETNVGKQFPCKVISVSIKQFCVDKKKRYINASSLVINDSCYETQESGITLQTMKSKLFKSWKGFVVVVPALTGYTLRGEMTIQMTDPQVQCIATIV